MFIYPLIQNAILRVLRKKNSEAFFNVSQMKCLSKHLYSKKPSLPCENPDRTPVYSFHS